MIRDGRGAFEWGLASTAIGGVLLIAAAFALVHWPVNPLDSSREGLVLQAASLSIAAFAVLSGTSTLAGIVFGLRAVMVARRVKRPLALGLSGVLLSVLATVAWTSVSLVWIGRLIE